MTAGAPELILPYGDLSARTASSKLRSGLGYAMLVGLKDKGWTHTQLGEAVGVDPTVINLLTHGQTDCSLETAGRILFALGVCARLVLENDSSPEDCRMAKRCKKVIALDDGTVRWSPDVNHVALVVHCIEDEGHDGPHSHLAKMSGYGVEIRWRESRTAMAPT